jgi:CubicO group peptidase (beta-lactamase class C family)
MTSIIMKSLIQKNLYMLTSMLFTATLSHAAHYPGEQWERVASPEVLGLSSEKLERAAELAESTDTEVIMVVVDGRVAWEWGDVTQKFNSHSIRKSLLSAMFGKYIADGTIDQQATMADLGIDDVGGLSEQEKQATVSDLMKARSGIYHPALYETKSMQDIKPERYSVLPGTHWCYNNWDFNALGTIFEQETGQGIFEAFQTDIAVPVGMQDYLVEDGTYITGAASMHQAYPFRFSTRDLARFGWLMLNNGNWEGNQVIAADWVAESTAYYSDATLFNVDGYGYMWWVVKPHNKNPHLPNVSLPDGSYTARGAGGHYLVIIPEYNMLVLHRVNTDIKGRRVTREELGSLLAAILDARM